MKNNLEDNTGVPAPLSSRREFMRAAAASGGAAMMSAGLVPISVDA
ncbi:MAG: twin-arginine translocation signal domain-containing protein, partial [Deltaproteobacteria bacterium]